MKPYVGALCLLLASLSLDACDDRASTVGADADCTLQLTFGDATYTEAGFLEANLRKIGSATRSPCNDTGHPATAAAEKVQVFEVPGHDPDDVVGAMEIDGTYRVFAADSLSEQEEAAVRSEFVAQERPTTATCLNVFRAYVELAANYWLDDNGKRVTPPGEDEPCRAAAGATTFGRYLVCSSVVGIRFGELSADFVERWKAQHPASVAECRTVIGPDARRIHTAALRYGGE